jgi:hypothetical protein
LPLIKEEQPLFGSFLDKLDSWVGRSFIVGSYIPFLIFGVANVLMAQFFYPDQLQTLIKRVQVTAFGPLDATFAFLAICAILAFITGPLVAGMTNLLRGKYLPNQSKPKQWLLSEQSKFSNALKDKVDDTGRDSVRINEKADEFRKRVNRARAAGSTLGTADDKGDLIGQAETALDGLWRKRSAGEGLAIADIDAAITQVERALRKNCEAERLLVRGELSTEGERRNARRLRAAYLKTIELIKYAKSHAEIEYTLALNRKQIEFSRSEIFATQFGNRYAALMSYFDERFNIDLDFLLPVLQTVVQDDKSAADTLVRGQQQIEFAIRMYLFVLVFTAAWLPLASLRPGAWLAVPIIGTLGLIFARWALAIVHASFTSFSDAVRAVCILKRFNVLQALRAPLPKDWEEEKSLWRVINYQLQWNQEKKGAGEAASLSYVHPGAEK